MRRRVVFPDRAAALVIDALLLMEQVRVHHIETTENGMLRFAHRR